MSLRNVRKIYGGPRLPDPEGSDDDFNPHSSFTFNYEGLGITSLSQSEHESLKSDDGNQDQESTPVVAEMKKKPKKKKKKAAMAQANGDLGITSLSQSEHESLKSDDGNQDQESTPVVAEMKKKPKKKKKKAAMAQANGDPDRPSVSPSEHEPSKSDDSHQDQELPPVVAGKKKKANKNNQKKAMAALANGEPDRPSESASYHEPSKSNNSHQDQQLPPVDARKKKKANKKNKKKATAAQANGEKFDDEVERSLREVNKILGEISVLPGTSASKAPEQEYVSCMQVEAKNLDHTYELKKKFGKEAVPKPQRGRQNPKTKLGMKWMIVPLDKYVFKKNGMSMSRVGHTQSFTIDHDTDYQRLHQEYLELACLGRRGEEATLNNLAVAHKNCMVEMMLQIADILFASEAYRGGIDLVEQVIAYYQYIACLKFDVTNIDVRLEYRFLENRPFHVAILKYIYILSNKACHRTALEMAKMLMNLDRTDPLATIMVIDVMALRAREHAWLLNAIGRWELERGATYLYNIQYSMALAQYHISMKLNGILKNATELLEKAMINFPSVVMCILDYCGQIIDPKLKVHPFFNSRAEKFTSSVLGMLTRLYAALIWEKWREQGVMEWFVDTAKKMCDRYDTDEHLRERLVAAEKWRMSLFSGYPPQVLRHINVLFPMTEMVADARVPDLRREPVIALSSDPAPSNVQGMPQTVNRYGYVLRPPTVVASTRNNQAFLDFFTTMLPD